MIHSTAVRGELSGDPERALATLPEGLPRGMALLTRIGLHSDYAADVLPILLIMGAGMGLTFAPSLLDTIATTAAAGYVTAHISALLLRPGGTADSGARTVAVRA